MKYVLDTNIVVAALNNRLPVVARLDAVSAPDEAVLSAIVLAELRYGALSSARVSDNLARIERLTRAFAFAPVDRAVAEHFSEIKAALRRRGAGKSDSDLLIAATALAIGGVLVTDDAALLDRTIEGLQVEDWIATLGG
ncbi:MAG: PIN domain-containing protein [Myxococcota bacterium]